MRMFTFHSPDAPSGSEAPAGSDAAAASQGTEQPAAGAGAEGASVSTVAVEAAEPSAPSQRDFSALIGERLGRPAEPVIPADKANQPLTMQDLQRYQQQQQVAARQTEIRNGLLEVGRAPVTFGSGTAKVTTAFASAEEVHSFMGTAQRVLSGQITARELALIHNEAAILRSAYEAGVRSAAKGTPTAPIAKPAPGPAVRAAAPAAGAAAGAATERPTAPYIKQGKHGVPSVRDMVRDQNPALYATLTSASPK